MKRFLRSIFKSIFGALRENEYIVAFRRKYPNFSYYISKRLSPTKPYGLFFTIGSLASAFFFFCFLLVARDVLQQNNITLIDVRIMNLIADFRDISIAKFFLFFTYLGSWFTILSLGFIVTLLFILLRKKLELFFFASTIAAAYLLRTVLKLAIHRVRPDTLYSLIPQEGFAFPSGHALVPVIFYGMIAYFVYRETKHFWQKFAVVFATFLLVFLIGFSRMYLGVHWFSDIIAGWYLGLTVLILILSFLEEQELFGNQAKLEEIFKKKKIALLIIFLIICEVVFILVYYQKHPLDQALVPLPEKIPVIISGTENLFNTIAGNSFPKFSETIAGSKMEPIGLIVIGTEEELTSAFKKSGWFVADRGIDKLPHLIFTTWHNTPYPEAPVTPSFLNSKPETIAFEKPTSLNSVRQRHHARFWITNYSFAGKPIWVATASFDDGLLYFIAHKIQPDIDTERDFVRDELLKTATTTEIQEIQLVKPTLGQNQGGDQFFTGGKAYIMFLK